MVYLKSILICEPNIRTCRRACMAPKGDGNKRNPVRLFSFDTFKTPSSRSSLDKPEHGLDSKPSTLDRILERRDQGSIVGETAHQNWTDQELVESPRLREEPLPFIRSERRVNLRKPEPLNLNTTATHEASEDQPLRSPSGARWERLRQHVLPVPTRSVTPPIPPSPHSSITSLPPRSQTPKPSRLARLGFRHVVDQVREVDVDDTRKFAAEIQNICWSIRPAEGHRIKVDREPTGSSLHLPFMSTMSLATVGSIDNLTHGSSKKLEVRRPPSVQSLAHAHYPVLSVRSLHQSLLRHATLSASKPLPASSLPLETLVLSTLLTPFVTFERGTHMEDERRLAAEAFSVITRTWPPLDEVSPCFCEVFPV